MPQDRISGADANAYGRETARKIATAIGAIPISETSNEFELDNRKITIRCARKKTQNLGAPYQLLERINAVIAALEQENGEYELYEISPDKFKQNMRPTRSTGPSGGRVGLVKKSIFINEGKFISQIKLKAGKDKIKRGRKIWRMAFRCGNQGPSLWEECKKYNVAAITYIPLEQFDLTNYKYNEPQELWDQLAPTAKSSLRHIACDMKNGDTIYVKEGTQIICKGTVLGEIDRAYVFDKDFRIVDPNGVPWPHQVPVAWDTTFKPINILLGAEQHTVLELNGERLGKLQKALSGIEAIVTEDLQAMAEEENFIYEEGGEKQKYVNYYERNLEIRIRAIKIHGKTCKACGFDFLKFYGERGKGYIEVHHKKPVSKLKEKTQIDPENDMEVLCSNCHRMIHRRKDEILTTEELRRRIKENA